jgi:ribonuclease PH
MNRPDGRAPDQLRAVTFQPGVAPHATGSVLVAFGSTRVLCAATVQEGVPRWMKDQNVKGGWLTAEYSMLPYSTLGRKPRDSSRGQTDGRSVEIQRLIGRSLRAVIDLQLLGQRTLWVDCDVLQADGGTRTAAITGACLACALAFDNLLESAQVVQNPLRQFVAAVSAGVYESAPVLDLNYYEDKAASVDANIVMTQGLDFVELQASGEGATFHSGELEAMLALARDGIAQLTSLQQAALAATRAPATGTDLADLARRFRPPRP